MINKEIPISDFDDIYIDSILRDLQKKFHLSQSTIDSTYRHLIVDPYLKYNEKEKHFTRSSYGRAFNFSYEETESFESALSLIPKSFSPEIDKKAQKKLFKDFKADGEKIGLAVMYSLGTRENEACAVYYEDIYESKRFPGMFLVRVGYRTTKINSKKLKSSGKSDNAPRIIPITKDEADFFLKRKNWIEEITGMPADKLPVVCVKNNLDKGCKTQNLCDYGRVFFEKELGIRSNDFSGISCELVDNFNTNPDFNEEEPTTYLFRRNFATKLYLADLTKAEREYLMGHEIGDETYNRYDFVDENMLYSIYKKRVKILSLYDSDNSTL